MTKKVSIRCCKIDPREASCIERVENAVVEDMYAPEQTITYVALCQAKDDCAHRELAKANIPDESLFNEKSRGGRGR